MTKTRWNFTIGAALALGLSASGAATAQDYEWPDFFTVVTPVVGTANHSLGVAWTSEFSAQTSSRSRVLPAPNGFARAEWLATGEGRIAMLQASDYFDQMDAVSGFLNEQGGPYDTRVAVMNLVTPWSYMVRGDSDIESFTDIGPDTRVAVAESLAFLVTGIDALLAYNGLTQDDVQVVEVGGYGPNTSVVVEGRADVAFTGPISGTSYEAEANPNGIRWLPLPTRDEDPEAYARYRALMPGYTPLTTVSGTESALGLNVDHAFQANHVRAEEDPEFVYQLARWLDEHYEDFADDFVHAPMMSVDSMVRFLEAGHLQPIHDGAIRYLDEIGVWNEEYQARNDTLVQLATERVALWQETLAQAREQGLDIGPESEEFRALWDANRTAAVGDMTYGELVLAIDE